MNQIQLHRVCLYIPEKVQSKLKLSRIMDLSIRLKAKMIDFDFSECDYITAEFATKEAAEEFELRMYDILADYDEGE